MKKTIALLGLLSSVALFATEPTMLWRSGDFAGARGGARVERGSDGDVLVLPKPSAYLARKIALKPEWRVLRLRGEMRVTDVPTPSANENWRTGRFAMCWKDAHGKTVTPWPGNIGLVGTTEWRSFDRKYAIPRGAAFLDISLCNLSSGGEVRFRNFSLEITRNFLVTPGNAPLPEGAPADAESLDGAWHETTPTRERFSLNGLWRVRPAFSDDAKGVPPRDNDCWAWTRLPDVWTPCDAFDATSEIAPYFEDHPERLAKTLPLRAWYARSLVLPAAAHRRTLVTFDMVASKAVAYVDGQRAGEVTFPNGEIDLTAFVKPGQKQTLALDVTAYAEGDTLDYNESTRADKRKKSVRNKGVTGDLWLDVVPDGLRIADVWAETSVERGEIRFVAETVGGKAPAPCRIRAEVTPRMGGATRVFEGAAETKASPRDTSPVSAAPSPPIDHPHGTVSFAAPWKDAALWDTDTPQNRYCCTLTLLDAAGKPLDTAVPFEFGFREVRLVGRDIVLNGKRIHLRALFDSTLDRLTSAASKPNAIARCRNVQAHGFNFMIAGNYSFAAGAVPYVEGMLSACDETGMLYSFTMPHFKEFSPLDDPAQQARYRETAHRLMRLARRHPAVLFWATSHNAAGYLGAGNPRRIDGLYELPASANGTNRRHARLAEGILRDLDPTRPVYHHESGNLGAWHCFNCYLDWAPVQERSDWPEHWATVGVKPLFFVEWGLPHISSWSSYRGPLFIWRGRGYMSLWASEYAAALRGDAAYEATEAAYRALDREESLWAAGKPFAWAQLHGGLRSVTNNYQGVQATFADDNWRAFRGWGVSAVLPWDQDTFFERVHSSKPRRPDDFYAKTPGWKTWLVTQWADKDDYVPSQIGAAVSRWNRDDCAWIGGADVFTTKRHHYAPEETVRKTLVIVNDRRHAQKVGWCVSLGAATAHGEAEVEAGGRAFVPVALSAPKAAGFASLRATFGFEGGVTRTDEFAIEVIAPASRPKPRLAVYDPKGMTCANLKRLGLAAEDVKDIFAFDVSGKNRDTCLVIGRACLTREILDRVIVPFAWSRGRTFVFEQDKPTLESLGFRVQSYLLRHAFARFEKPSLKGAITDSRLRDWAGETTLVEKFDPLRDVETCAGQNALWAGFPGQSRVWRCGNRGAVASVLPEKPSFGDWCALVDGGFDLQYAPLLEWRIGDGAVTFCQLDVTARTEADPAADEIVRAVLTARREAFPPARSARPLGMQAYAIGRQPRAYGLLEHHDDKAVTNRFLVTEGASEMPADFFTCVSNGATALLCGLSAEEVRRWCPLKVKVEEVRGRHFTRIDRKIPELNGLSNADWAWHGAMDFAAFTGDAGEGNEALRVFRVGKGRLVFWQVPPWKIDDVKRPYLRTSRRRAEAMLSRLLGNLGFVRGGSRILYADVPLASDDPYRYYHW